MVELRPRAGSLPVSGSGPSAAKWRAANWSRRLPLKIDEHARVLGEDGRPIEGLYAAGNTAAAMSGRVYPGAGTPIGSSLAFAYLAVLDIAG